jgi:hypothetical protein
VVAMESGKQRQRENIAERYRFQHQPILSLLVTKNRRTSASGGRRASLPSCIFICNSQTLARPGCRLFALATRTCPEPFQIASTARRPTK